MGGHSNLRLLGRTKRAKGPLEPQGCCCITSYAPHIMVRVRASHPLVVDMSSHHAEELDTATQVHHPTGYLAGW